MSSTLLLFPSLCCVRSGEKKVQNEWLGDLANSNLNARCDGQTESSFPVEFDEARCVQIEA